MNINISEMVRQSIARALRDAADQLEGGASISAAAVVPAPGPSRIGAKVQAGTPRHHVLSLPSGARFRPSDVSAATGRSAVNVNATLHHMKKAGTVRNVQHGIWERV